MIPAKTGEMAAFKAVKAAERAFTAAGTAPSMVHWARGTNKLCQAQPRLSRAVAPKLPRASPKAPRAALAFIII